MYFNKRAILALVILFCIGFPLHADELITDKTPPEGVTKNATNTNIPLSDLSLAQCLDIALEQNRNRSVSSLSLEIAEYQHKQALSSYWPRILFNSAFLHMDEELNFIFPQETSDYTIALSPSSPPLESTVTVPEKKVKLTDRDIGVSFLDLSLPIYTGGIRSAIIEQTKAGIEAAKQEARRTDLLVIYDVKRVFYGAVLAQNIQEISNAALARLNATLTLTERLYTEGSGSVSKRDYLKMKIFVESVRSAVAMLSSNTEIAKAALVNMMGLAWNSAITLSETTIPFHPYEADIEKIVGNAYKFNPDWKRLIAGLDAVSARIKEEKGERKPKFMLSGTLWNVTTGYDSGITSDENKDGWKVGVGMQIPIFSGFLTTNKINEAKARFLKMQQQQILLKEGIALQIKHAFILMDGYKKQVAATEEALRNAQDNLDITLRAYDSDLVEVKDVVEAQLICSFMETLNLQALYKHAETQFQIEFLVGKQMNEFLEKT